MTQKPNESDIPITTSIDEGKSRKREGFEDRIKLTSLDGKNIENQQQLSDLKEEDEEKWEINPDVTPLNFEISDEPRSKKYLAYIPCDGFGNQILSLVHGFYFAWLTQRILIVPPILDHFEAPARGNCYDPSIPGFTNQNDIIQGLFFFNDFFKYD